MTAERPAADADASDDLCLIPDADLPKLYPGLKDCRQIFYQFPEIDPSVRRKIKQHLIIIKSIFRIDQLHLQIMLPDLLQTDPKRLLFLLTVCGLLLDILLGRQSEHRL